ncbi:MAG: thymidylate kinase [Planctomycetes bacterium]|nr:thymidylate kinase [Planctomycetota bacterium]
MSQLQFFGNGLPYVKTSDYPGVLISIEGTDGVGRTTQMIMLREWLEVQGYGVVETGWTRSPLIGRTIAEAKQGRSLNRFTYSLLYAADFADRLEKEILPALRSGFVVLSDRYVFTAFARDVVRGCDRDWTRDLFGFAPIPQLVLYLKIDVPTLIRRAISRGMVDFFEAGMDMNLGDDPYDSFKQYQTLLTREYNNMAREFNFHLLNARMKPERIHERIRTIVSDFFAQRKFHNWQVPDDVEPASKPTSKKIAAAAASQAASVRSSTPNP